MSFLAVYCSTHQKLIMVGLYPSHRRQTLYRVCCSLQAKLMCDNGCEIADTLSSGCDAVISSPVAALTNDDPSTVFTSQEGFGTHVEDSLSHTDSFVGEQLKNSTCTALVKM